jgi:hypothetical protein
MAKNSCDCPNPPGGTVVCEADQLAICRVKNGKTQAECVTPPPNLKGHALKAWALGVITKKKRSLTGVPRLDNEDREILEAGEFEDPVTGELVMFRLPK